MNKRNYYWDDISELISLILKSHISYDMSVLEVGFGCGHFLEHMYEQGYKNLHGIEIRYKQFCETKQMFAKKNISNVELLYGDILKHQIKYDAIFSTGLVQCLREPDRDYFFEHIAKLTDKALFTVPQINVDRNTLSSVEIGVTGCKEFKTGNIPLELSKFFNIVRVGLIDKSLSRLKDNFVYYVCTK